MSDSAGPEPEKTWWLYEKALGMIEAQVDRQWSITQFFIVLNATVIGGAIALLQAGASRAAAFLALVAFAGGFGLCLIGMRAMGESKRYYRTLVAKKTLLEERLRLTGPMPGHAGRGIAIFALGPLATAGKISEILADVDAYATPRVRLGSASGWAWTALAGLSMFDLVGVVIVANALAGCGLPIPCEALG